MVRKQLAEVWRDLRQLDPAELENYPAYVVVKGDELAPLDDYAATLLDDNTRPTGTFTREQQIDALENIKINYEHGTFIDPRDLDPLPIGMLRDFADKGHDWLGDIFDKDERLKNLAEVREEAIDNQAQYDAATADYERDGVQLGEPVRMHDPPYTFEGETFNHWEDFQEAAAISQWEERGIAEQERLIEIEQRGQNDTTAPQPAETPLQVTDAQTGETKTLTEFVTATLEGRKDDPGPQGPTAMAAAHYQEEAAIWRIGQSIEHGEPLRAEDVSSLTLAALDIIDQHGEDYLHFMIEQARPADLDQGLDL